MQRKGMPSYDDKGPRNSPRYDSAACIKWLESYNLQKLSRSTDDDDQLDIDEIRRRRELTGLKKDQIALAVVEERYGDIEAIMESLEKSLAEVRSTLMSIPGLSGQMAFQDTSTIEKLLTEEISRALDGLSEYEPETD
jgi:phage terminase Nu1 subunit (DNA packaging protein)